MAEVAPERNDSAGKPRVAKGVFLLCEQKLGICFASGSHKTVGKEEAPQAGKQGNDVL